MANAKPAGMRVQVVDPNRRPEVNIKAGEFLVRLKDGSVVHRRILNTGNVITSRLSRGEYPDAITESKFRAELKKVTGGTPEEEPSDG